VRFVYGLFAVFAAVRTRRRGRKNMTTKKSTFNPAASGNGAMAFLFRAGCPWRAVPEQF
jgi:transposase